ncbi:hypothetical protein [Phenylobacterium sp.]|uniref:hypothetical protein n=1 Tax=Phenylobacterium sp. TaxID=1871053 RepID=UPI0027302D84|nr:hypothetical protein [Phenylobacterium sp.]MDP1599043.1 hypothetical protein [Phenylobacterium sp.]MDP3590471.1 hypothetical protein [Phenylobacterium sp.]
MITTVDFWWFVLLDEHHIAADDHNHDSPDIPKPRDRQVMAEKDNRQCAWQGKKQPGPE